MPASKTTATRAATPPAPTDYGVTDIVTQKTADAAARQAQMRELADMAGAFCDQLVTQHGWLKGPAQQLTAAVMTGIVSGKGA